MAAGVLQHGRLHRRQPRGVAAVRHHRQQLTAPVLAGLALVACAPPPDRTPCAPATVETVEAVEAVEQSAPTTLVLVRHAEKASEGGDPPLTDAGKARAEALAHVLGDAGVSAIFVSDWTRSRQTASPLAERLGLPLLPYDPDRAEEEVRRIVEAHPGQTIVVIGHKPSVPRMVNALVGEDRMTVLERYDDLVVVVVAHPTVSLLRMRYGAP